MLPLVASTCLPTSENTGSALLDHLSLLQEAVLNVAVWI